MKPRRLLAAVAGVTLLAAMAISGPADADPGGAVVAEQWAEGDWTVFTSRTHGVWYVASVFRGAAVPFGVENDAFVAKGTCTRTFMKDGWMMSCQASGKGHQLGLDEFQMDPMLSSADLSFRQGKYRQVVHWTGTGDAPGPQADAGADPAGAAGAGVGMVRDAKASAHIFRVSLKPQPLQFAFLVQDAGAFAYGGMSVTFGGDGSFHVERTYRVP